MSEILEEIFEKGRARGEAESAKKLSQRDERIFQMTSSLSQRDERISQMAADMERMKAEIAALKSARL